MRRGYLYHFSQESGCNKIALGHHYAALNENANIVIEDNLVKEIVKGEISEENFIEIIDAERRVVIPGLTDAHVHLSHDTSEDIDTVRVDELAVRSTKVARNMLLWGFTTVRDAGGITYGLKKNIDNGFLDGPHIFPSNAYISQTCVHGDTRGSRASERLFDGNYTSPSIQNRFSVIADGVPEVLRAVREQLFLGASQIKLMAAGGISSKYDPLETIQFTFEEMKAAVDAAAVYGTYVMTHLYTPKAMQRAVKAGVKSLEHTSCASGIIGDDIDAIAADLQQEYPDTIMIPIHCEGFKSKICASGFDTAFLSINKYILKKEKVPKEKGLVNLFAPTTVSFADQKEMERMLSLIFHPHTSHNDYRKTAYFSIKIWQSA